MVGTETIIYGTMILAIVIALLGIRIVRPFEKGLVERMGKYQKTSEQGFTWIIPVIDRMIKVNMRETMMDVEPQKIITKDDLNADVDAVVYYRVKDPKKAIYNADDYDDQIVSLSKTTLRDIIGKMTLSEANNKRNTINDRLKSDLNKQTDEWGIDIVRVELQRIEPPADVQEAMNKVVKAEKDKVSAKDFATAVETKADGDKRAEIKMAEGIKQSAILKAEGEAKAIREIATAEAERIRVVNQSIQTNFKREAQVYKKLETTEKALMHNSKIVVDPKSNMTNVISDMSGVLPLPTQTRQDREKKKSDK